MAELDLVKTGISGLDAILSSGIPRGNVILLEGGTGTGKTTMGVEFVYRGAGMCGEPGIIVLFEVSPDRLVRDAACFGWDLPALERQRKLKIIFTTRQVFQQETRVCDVEALPLLRTQGKVVRIALADVGGNGKAGFANQALPFLDLCVLALDPDHAPRRSHGGGELVREQPEAAADVEYVLTGARREPREGLGVETLVQLRQARLFLARGAVAVFVAGPGHEPLNIDRIT